MSKISTGILYNAEPLSTESIKNLEKKVLEDRKAFVYLNENGELCFAIPSVPESIKDLAWQNAYEMYQDEGLLIRKVYKKTGLKSYELKETLQKESLDDFWSEAGRLVLKAIDGKVPEGWEYHDYRIEIYNTVLINAGESLPEPGEGDELIRLADIDPETGYNVMYTLIENPGPYTLEEAREFFKEKICEYQGKNSWEDFLIGEFGTADVVEDEEFWNHLMVEQSYARDSTMSWVYITEKSFIPAPPKYWSPQVSIYATDPEIYDEIFDITVTPALLINFDDSHIIIPEGYTNIYRGMFNSNQAVSITLPKSLTYIDEGAFAYCNNLEKVIIQSDVDVHRRIFERCPLLKTAGPIGGDFNIEYSWTNAIPEVAFYNCESLESIVIPENITKIGYNAFNGCSNLKNITFLGTVAQWNMITLREDWNTNIPATKVICTDGSVCLVCTGGAATTCQEKAICEQCGSEYGDYGPHNSVDGICVTCGIECTTIESEHNPYSKNDYNILGTWDYSTAKSVNITVTYQTADYREYCTIASGILTSAYSNKSGDYLTNSGAIQNSNLGKYNHTKFYGPQKNTVTFENVDMLKGSVIFYSSASASDYYGVHVTVTPNY
jgi:hypothetical protein